VYSKNEPKMSRRDKQGCVFINLFAAYIIGMMFIVPGGFLGNAEQLHKGNCMVVNYGLEEKKANVYDENSEIWVEKSKWKIWWYVYYNSVEKPRFENKLNEAMIVWNPEEEELYDSIEVAKSKLEKYNLKGTYQCSLYGDNHVRYDDYNIYQATRVEFEYMIADGYIVAIFGGSLICFMWIVSLCYYLYDQYCRGCCDGYKNDIEKGYKGTIEKVESIKQKGVKDKYPEVKVVEKDSTEESSSEEDSSIFDSAMNTEEEEKRKEQLQHKLNVAMEKVREYCRQKYGVEIDEL
jgi:hypothetical protein